MDAPASWLLIIGAYFFGAVPTAYWAARAIKGIDIRRYGSGNVGVANFSRQVGVKWAVPVGLFDIAVKGPLPIVLASSKVLDLGLEVEILAGIATIIGHNWSVFIRFSGGRAMGTVLGVTGSFDFLLVWTYIITSFVVWLAIRRTDSAISWGIAAVLLPLYSFLLGLPAEVTWFTLGFLLITAIKRATSNDPGALRGRGSLRTLALLLLTRVVFDRDTRSKERWVARRPVESEHTTP